MNRSSSNTDHVPGYQRNGIIKEKYVLCYNFDWEGLAALSPPPTLVWIAETSKASAFLSRICDEFRSSAHVYLETPEKTHLTACSPNLTLIADTVRDDTQLRASGKDKMSSALYYVLVS